MKSTDLWQKGNLKVPATTWVVNSGSAAKCPARALGLCQAGKDGISCYGYTARTDLDLTKLQEVSQVNVSNDLGEWQDKGANRSKIIRKGDDKPRAMCPGNCRNCRLCVNCSGIEIGIALH